MKNIFILQSSGLIQLFIFENEDHVSVQKKSSDWFIWTILVETLFGNRVSWVNSSGNLNHECEIQTQRWDYMWAETKTESGILFLSLQMFLSHK